MFSKTIVASTLVAAVSAHQNFHQFWVNGETPGYQVGIRMPPSNSPVTDVTSEDMACNVNGQTGVADTIEASEGDTIKVQWDQSGHPGPITHMLFGPVDSAKDATGVGSWFKIDELDYVDGKWASEIMGAQNMSHEFKLPTGLPSGEYLLRSEMLALHAAQTVGGGQFYMGCAQLKIAGTGSATCGPTIKLPGAYKAEDKNIYIPNYYNGFDATDYTAPGGPVASCGAGSGNSTAPVASEPASNSTTPATSAVVASVSTISTSFVLASEVTATPTATAVVSSAPAASATAAPTEISTPSPIESAAQPTATSGSGSDSTLPETFTISEFISWLEKTTGGAAAKRFARALGRRAHARQFA